MLLILEKPSGVIKYHPNVLSYDPTKFLEKLAEILEKETHVYMASDPDPFEERHPCRVDPDCQVMPASDWLIFVIWTSNWSKKNTL